jgi:hypothetical protein
MLPTRRSLPELDLASQDQIGNEFQSRFLDYRLQNYSTISTTIAFEMPNFTSGMKDCVRALAVPLLGHRQFERQLLDDLQP